LLNRTLSLCRYRRLVFCLQHSALAIYCRA
jgi:hypothetical protein